MTCTIARRVALAVTAARAPPVAPMSTAAGHDQQPACAGDSRDGALADHRRPAYRWGIIERTRYPWGVLDTEVTGWSR
jgi:hypothetical protein